MGRDTRSSSITHPAGGTDWLPLRRHQPVVASKALQPRYVDAHKDSDWFLRFAAEMEAHDPDQGPQSRLLVKFYLFMRDYFPYGFTGTYAYIDGNEVMRHLLCHAEHTASRHKVSRSAETSWSELDKWMSRGKTWDEALKSAKPVSRSKKLAPGLHTPAGLLAVLILAHPDPRFKTLVGRLQIDWMIQKRENLAAESGFWEGINSSNIYTVFRPEDPRQAEVEMLADYSQIFAKFIAARKNIHPFLPASHADPYVQLQKWN